mmetsp:Transcript_33793/g.49661  ORF Transcript_33793/g.49661 Transcript_33793/m.49661 type:complete len:267 (+) Transcript_33793:237-1037(+)|eukprot:CAMPEP_0195522876 /NCGR_PEP_ID=MMETSP0794_2-20130614/21462_1 /TAXON_ID=515487 /ORGANISM="Stephanopyxis turris, Strain CCMP 815" /LENGTH=266 /DNA_ID=CAMNT_0040652735 /DNA_START=226 /DNA_END=1026 /DNA_ORIENTATION=-
MWALKDRLLSSLFILASIVGTCHSFLQSTIPHSSHEATRFSTSTSPRSFSSSRPTNDVISRFMSQWEDPKSIPPAAFEMQELRAQLDGMVKASISSSSLTPTKRFEIESYVRSVVQKCDSPIPLTTLSDNNNDQLIGLWRLGFSTEDATLNVLPKEASVLLDIKDGRRLDYILKFTKKVMGLNEITAKSTYTVDSGSRNPGLVAFIYNEITTGMFGMTLPIGFFGLLKGRANYVESVFFDGSYWIEVGYNPQGVEYYNVYFKVKDE